MWICAFRASGIPVSPGACCCRCSCCRQIQALEANKASKADVANAKTAIIMSGIGLFVAAVSIALNIFRLFD